jgi:E3 SUMO-protein ligase PIAS1
VEQVAVEPNGVWSTIDSNHTHGHQANSDDDDDDDDDDLIEITQLPRMAMLKSEALMTPTLARTPPQSSREQSITSTIQRSGGQKRPAAIIDLTISEDEESPPRAPKRRTTSHVASPASFDSLPSRNMHGHSDDSSSLSFSIPKQTSRSKYGS